MMESVQGYKPLGRIIFLNKLSAVGSSKFWHCVDLLFMFSVSAYSCLSLPPFWLHVSLLTITTTPNRVILPMFENIIVKPSFFA